MRCNLINLLNINIINNDTEHNQIIFTWVREAVDINETTFALVAMKKYVTTDKGKSQMINFDLQGKANKAAIARFEALILEPIKQRLQQLLPAGRAIKITVIGN